MYHPSTMVKVPLQVLLAQFVTSCNQRPLSTMNDALVSAALMCIRSCKFCRTPESTGVLDMLVGMCRLGKCWLCCMSVQVRRQISKLLFELIGSHLDVEVIDCSTCTDAVHISTMQAWAGAPTAQSSCRHNLAHGSMTFAQHGTANLVMPDVGLVSRNSLLGFAHNSKCS